VLDFDFHTRFVGPWRYEPACPGAFDDIDQAGVKIVIAQSASRLNQHPAELLVKQCSRSHLPTMPLILRLIQNDPNSADDISAFPCSLSRRFYTQQDLVAE
jgi:hypothetical protein